MPRRLAALSLVVDDYDRAITFFVGTLGFELREDTWLSADKRWVRVAPPGAETEFVIARAATDTQRAAIGAQGGGRVWLFLESNDFRADHAPMRAAGVVFETEPRTEPYGEVAVFRDPWGNRWDLIQYADPEGRSGTRP